MFEAALASEVTVYDELNIAWAREKKAKLLKSVEAQLAAEKLGAEALRA